MFFSKSSRCMNQYTCRSLSPRLTHEVGERASDVLNVDDTIQDRIKSAIDGNVGDNDRLELGGVGRHLLVGLECLALLGATYRRANGVASLEEVDQDLEADMASGPGKLKCKREHRLLVSQTGVSLLVLVHQPSYSRSWLMAPSRSRTASLLVKLKRVKSEKVIL